MEKKVFKNLSFHFPPFSLQIDTSKIALEFYWTFFVFFKYCGFYWEISMRLSSDYNI